MSRETQSEGRWRWSLRRMTSILGSSFVRRHHRSSALSENEENSTPFTRTQAADNEDHTTEEQQQGLPCAHLEALFGQTTGMNLDVTHMDVDGVATPAMKWNEYNIEQLIDHFGPRVLRETNAYQMSLIHFAVQARQLKCAKTLFQYAAEKEFLVPLGWSGNNLLKWSLDQNSERLIEFVLGRMAEKCASPCETAEIMGDEIARLVQGYPQIIEPFLRSNTFSFEHGRVQVARSLFDNRPGVPIAVLDHAPTTWKALSDNEVKDFWRKRGLWYFFALDRSHSGTVMASLKCMSIRMKNNEEQSDFINALLKGTHNISVFKAEGIRNLVDWRWLQYSWHKKFFGFHNNVFSALLFFAFVTLFGVGNNDSHSYLTDYRTVISLALFCSLSSVLWQPFLGIIQQSILLYLLVHCCVMDHHTDWTSFLTSLQCILYFLSAIQGLRPFPVIGPFVSMISYVLQDVWPFVMLGTLMIVTFGMAFVVLFADRLDEDDGQSFNSPWRAFESMFYAIIGQFDPEIFYTPSTSFLTFWRSLLFYLFLFLASIVLLSLLVAVLGDTCDRVMLTREAETIKSRAGVVAGTLSRMNSEASARQAPLTADELEALGYRIANNDCRSQMCREHQDPVSRFVIWPFLCSEFVRLMPTVPGNDCKVLWYLVPVTSVATSPGSPWQGRLVAMSNLIAEKMERRQEKADRDISRLESSVNQLHQRMHQMQQRQESKEREMQDRLNRIEEKLDRLLSPAPRSSREDVSHD